MTSRHDVELERRSNFIAARRRILEREVLKFLIGDNNNHTYEELEQGDEYEEVLFDPSKAANETAAALVSGGKSAERKRRSNSDSDLYVMDENREVELCSASKTVLKITLENDAAAEVEMPEQGFYRVYDDLEKIREFDLIPYVLERKKRQQELKLLDFEKKGADAEVSTDKTSPDSGRASVVSSDLSETAGSSNGQDKGKSAKSDAGSSCSADSGTYTLYPEAAVSASAAAAVAPAVSGLRQRSRSNDFLKRLSVQLSAVALRPSPPPMPPKGRVTPPPPLPPRTFSRCQRSSRRKDLSTHLGLVSEGSSPSDRAVAHEVAMRNFPPQLAGSGTSPPGKKDLKRHLGVHEITGVMPPAQNNILKVLSPPKPSQLLVQLQLHQRRPRESPEEPDVLAKTPPRSASPSSSGPYSAKKSCRRELDFGAGPTRLTEATVSSTRGLDAPPHPPPPPTTTTPGSVFKALATPGRIGGRSVAYKMFFKRQCQTPKRHSSSRSPSPSKLKSDGLTPVSGRKFKAKESRRSFLSSLLLSAKTKPVSASADPILAPLKNEAAAVRCRSRDHSRTVEEALRDGLPVIPFGSSSLDELTTDRESNVYLPMGASASSAARSGTWSPGSSAGLASAMATPARGARQHCLSCTCKGNAGTPITAVATSEWDYVRMKTPMMRQKRRKSLGEIVTGSFIA